MLEASFHTEYYIR